MYGHISSQSFAANLGNPENSSPYYYLEKGRLLLRDYKTRVLVPQWWVNSGTLPLKGCPKKDYFGSDVAVHGERDSRIMCEVFAIAAVSMKILHAGTLTLAVSLKPQFNTVWKVSLPFLFYRRGTGLTKVK